MPSSPGYKRDLKQERKTELARGGAEKNIERKQARRDMEKAGLVKPFKRCNDQAERDDGRCNDCEVTHKRLIFS